MNQILVLIIFLVGAACCQGQTPSTVNQAPDTVVATVLDKKITTKDATHLNGTIFGILLEKYAEENKIVPTGAEMNTFLVGMDDAEKRHQSDLDSRKASLTQELKSPTLTEQVRRDKESSLQTVEQSLKYMHQSQEQTDGKDERFRSTKLGIAKQLVTKWKVNQSLYAQCGGRVIFQQAGAEPMDAYRAFLKDEQTKGEFKILDAKDEASFWEYFDVANTSTYSKEDADKMMSTPWWTKNNAASH